MPTALIIPLELKVAPETVSTEVDCFESISFVIVPEALSKYCGISPFDKVSILAIFPSAIVTETLVVPP